jgi:acetoin utilization protein AcuB
MKRPELLKIASKQLVTIDVDAPAAAALQLMQAKKIRHLVVTQENLALGVLSQRDLMKGLRLEIEDLFSVRIQSTHFDETLSVRDIMSWPIKSVVDNQPLLGVTEMMVSEKVSSLLVLNSNDEVVGIVTTEDLLKLLIQFLKPGETATQKTLQEISLSPLGNILGLLSNTGV